VRRFRKRLDQIATRRQRLEARRAKLLHKLGT
jgi:hypothetical protein